jgi:hypothetical protein
LHVLGKEGILLKLTALKGLETTLLFLDGDLPLLKLFIASRNITDDVVEMTPESICLVAQRCHWVKAFASIKS